MLFSPGSDGTAPLHVFQGLIDAPRQVVPNPGTDHPDIIAVVRGDGCVQLFNTKLESQGGWNSETLDLAPVSGICDLFTPAR